MKALDNYKFTKDHEWITMDGDTAIIGITAYAADQLGDIVFVDINTVGETLNKEEVFGTIEAVKTVSDIFLPIGGEVLEFNEALEGNPGLINSDPYGEGWIIKLKPANVAEMNELMDENAYNALIG
ncbi:MAG: glycine cleavage system protein GcvH [Bacteroidales bacterium]|jgi:glycine cleavage system H protein|nr:glycine cleavage system protein GcvH [Bacteroidales bacterium]MBR4219157.1 glycine cleavage system protein GcvH [Bacteroidales bacterium]